VAGNAYNPVRGPNPAHSVLAGTIAPQGTGAPVQAAGLGFTVSRQAAGRFRITLAERYPAILAVVPGLALQTDATRTIVVKNIVSGMANDNYFDLQVLDASAAAVDLSANAANLVFFVAHLSNTTLPGS
jgi:hypothetical protein